MWSNVLYLVWFSQELSTVAGYVFCGDIVAQRRHALPKFEIHPSDQAIFDDISHRESVESLPCFNALNSNENFLDPILMQL